MIKNNYRIREYVVVKDYPNEPELKLEPFAFNLLDKNILEEVYDVEIIEVTE